MIFFFKRPILNVDVFTCSANVYEFTPVVRASKCVPEWWINTPPSGFVPSNSIIPTFPNIKTCDGVKNLFSSGMMFQIPVDTYLLVGNNEVNGQAKVSVIPVDSNKYFDHHPDEMFGNFLKQNKYLTLRINLPYLVKTKEDIQWTLMEPLWSATDHRYRIVPGNTNFKYHRTVAAHMLFQHNAIETYRIFLPMHQPLLHAIPHTEKKIKIHNHLITNDEFTNMNMSAIPGKFGQLTKFLKEHEKDKPKCPVSHWMR